jgi:hypothetical protein
MTDLGYMTLAQLYEDRDLLDKVVRAVSLEIDEGYAESLAALEQWAGAAASLAGHNSGTRLRLGAIVDKSPLTLDRLERDVCDIGGRTEKARTFLLSRISRDLPPEPEGNVETDRRGNVLISADRDRGALLADPVEVEREYQAARHLDDAYTGPDGRERFEEDLRVQTEGGVDLVATLQHQRREAELNRVNLDAEHRELTRERFERERRAKERRRGALA